jgi:glycosyltransferase involved in cell wall biosynthesis
MKISLIQPSRNNLKYLKWSYKSIRKNQGNHEVEICVADDFSDKDMTWDWCEMMMREDPLFKAIRNEGPTRLGHTILYDKLVNETATSDICMIWHADMYLCPGALDAIEKHLKEKTIVSLTRIEPPLHPPGPEKILLDCGIEPEEFDESKLLSKVNEFKVLHENDEGITEGIFAPWAFWKKDFQEIGGHDPLYAPQSKEDSDIFNRFQLNGIKFVQTWEGFVYHMTCRGSRFADGATRNPNGQVFMKNRETDEWLEQNQKATRNFIRKWGHFVKHDQYLKPIIPPKYDIGFIAHNCNKELLHALEPWCSDIFLTMPQPSQAQGYILEEQKNTKIDILKKIHPMKEKKYNDVLVEFDASHLNENNVNNILFNLSAILSDSGEIGEFELDVFKIKVNKLKTYEDKLIKV